MCITIEKVRLKLSNSSYGITSYVAEALYNRLVQCADILKPNIVEWLDSKPFSDIWIRDKYCLNAVLKIRGNPTSPFAVADAILSLDAYAVNEENEHMLWQRRM